jgi:hypothetical protein
MGDSRLAWVDRKYALCRPLFVRKSKCWVEWRQRGPKKDSSLERRQQANADGKWKHSRNDPAEHAISASRTEKGATGDSLKAVNRLHILNA